MKKKTLPTIIGLLLLIISLAFGVSLISYQRFFRLGASGELAPKNVRISNLSDSSFTITWTTDKATSGFIEYGGNQNSLGKVEKEQASGAGLTHLVRVSGANPETSYFFKINSGGRDFDNNGVVWQVKTGPALPKSEQNLLASGNILTATGSPAKNALVYISVNGNLLSTLTSENGSWLIPLSSYSPINPATTLLEITVQAGLGEIASAQVFPQSANPTPAIILGQVFDFRNLPPFSKTEVPGAFLNAPENREPVSGFNLESQPTGTSNKSVTLESIDEGETVTSTTPEFFGEAPAGTSLEITLLSETITGQVTVDNNGEWKWAPPKELEEGSHKITLSWKDEKGILRTLIRTFVVQAAEGPAFEATPSATLRASPSATLTPTPAPTLTPTSTPEATLPPQPESGNLTPTLILSIMGIGILVFSIFIWKQADA